MDSKSSIWNTSAPAFPVPETKKEWLQKREQVRKQLIELSGFSLPAPDKTQAMTVSTVERDGCLVEKVFIDSGWGPAIPSWLLSPLKASAPSPAVLYLHQHGGKYSVGKDQIFEEWSYGIAHGLELVKQGFVVLAPDAPGFGERQGQGPGGPLETGSAEEHSLFKALLWMGHTLWGAMIHDDLIALNYLCSRVEVDEKRIGVTGMSMGATRSWWLAALDERPACISAVACLTRYEELMGAGLLRAHGIYYFVPALLRHFDTEAVLSLIAPRPFRIQLGDRDDGSPVDGARKLIEITERFYQLYDSCDMLKTDIYPDMGHEYTASMWQETVTWLEMHLKS